MSETKISKLNKLIIKLEIYESIVRQLQSVMVAIRASIDIERNKL